LPAWSSSSNDFEIGSKELDTRAVLLEFAYEFRTAARDLERDERELMVRAASPIHGEYAPR
jgi:hypothetical protein